MLEDRSPLVLPLRDPTGKYEGTHETLSAFAPSSLSLADLLSPEAHCKRDELSCTRMNIVEALVETVSPGKKRPSLHQRALLSSSPLNYFNGNTLELNSNLSRVTTLMLSSPQLSSPSETKPVEHHQIMGYDTEKEEDTFYIGDDESPSITSAPSKTTLIDGKKKSHDVVIDRENAQSEPSTWFPAALIASSRHRDVKISRMPSSPLPIRKRRATIDTPSLAETNSCLEQSLRLSDSPMKTYKSHNIGISTETEWEGRQPRLPR